MNDAEDPILYTVAEAAQRLGKGPRWLADRIRDGRVEHVRLGRSIRLTPEQLQKLVGQHVRAPSTTSPIAAVDPLGRVPRRRQRAS